MPDQPASSRPSDDAGSPFDELINGASASAQPSGTGFATAFRGYDKDEVDRAIASLTARLRSEADEREEAHGRERDDLERQAAETAELLAAAEARTRELDEQLEAARANEQELTTRLENLEPDHIDKVAGLEADLAEASARAENAEAQVEALAAELTGGESESRHRFEEVLRVAEDQASVIIRNATTQADRLLEAAREEIANRRKDMQAEADAVLSRAQHDAEQVRLRIDTELTAHQSQIEREAAHAAEKVAQAEQEAAAVRSEAEKGAAALRSLVSRETETARAEADEAVREQRVRVLEFEESLTRRQDDAQQEFLMLHNQAVAHAERITQDANDQVTSSLEHAQRVSAKADDFDRLMRTQAAHIEAEAKVRAGQHLERAYTKAQKIIETVTTHSQSVLRDAEDRARQLRWQQHQLTSFMSEVTELIRPDGVLTRAVVEDEETAVDEPDAADGAEFATDVVEHESEPDAGDTDDHDGTDDERGVELEAVEVDVRSSSDDDFDDELEDDPAFTVPIVIEEIPEPRSARSAADDIEAQRDGDA